MIHFSEMQQQKKLNGKKVKRALEKIRKRMVWGCFFSPTRRTSDSWMKTAAAPSTSAPHITDLPDSIISNISSMLDAKNALRFSQTCSHFRSIVHSMPPKPFMITNKELVYRYNYKKYRQEIHILKIGRSIHGVGKREKPFHLFAENLHDLLLPQFTFKGAITFEYNVNIPLALSEILHFSSNAQIYPEIFRFQGGGFPREMSNFKKIGELKLIEAFQKLSSLKEVHFLTSKHFDFPTPPTTLLYLCDQLSHLSLVYDNIQFDLEDILLAVQFWRSISPNFSTVYHLNLPKVSISAQNNMLELIEASKPFESDYINNELSELTFFHSPDSSLTLSFHFH